MTAAQLELITAAVDGELSAQDRRAVRALLAASPAAQQLYAKLKSDRARLRALPSSPPPVDLQAKILAKIASAAPAPAKPQVFVEPSRKTVLPTPRRRSWVPAAVAASLLLGVSVGSFAFFRNAGPQNQSSRATWAHVLPAQPDGSASLPSPLERPGGKPHRDDVRLDVLPVPRVPAPREMPPVPANTVALAPAPRSVAPDLTGFPVRPPLPPFERIEVRVPFLRPVADLGRENVSQELREAIEREPGVTPMRFDLFVRDTARGAELFQNAAKADGIVLHTDATTLDRLKKKQVHALAIYTEALTPAELIALFAKLASEDAKFSPRVGESLHAAAIVRTDELDLKTVLGVDVGLYKRPVGNGHNPVTGQGGHAAPDKSVSSGTIDRVVQSVSGSPSSGAPAAQASDKHAVLLTWQTAHPSTPRTNPVQSAELKHYLQKRGDRKPTAVPALIVIRAAG